MASKSIPFRARKLLLNGSVFSLGIKIAYDGSGGGGDGGVCIAVISIYDIKMLLSTTVRAVLIEHNGAVALTTAARTK